MRSIFAPIVLFVYNRPQHTRQTVDALLKNFEAKNSDLFVYADGVKGDTDIRSVAEIRSYILTIRGFKSINIVEREKNYGLAENIIQGVSEVVDQYGSIIVLEDDIVTSPYFLTYMNKALNFYENEKKVWHISGWNYPIETGGLPDTFLWRVMNCSGGWSTWADRWKYFEKDTEKLTASFSEKAICRFNVDGHENFWSQVLLNIKGEINTWAIFWYAAIFLNNGLCLNPSLSYARNIGHDGSGVHCGNSGYRDNDNLNFNDNPAFPANVMENKMAVEVIKQYFLSQRKSLPKRIINKLARFILKRNIF